MKFNNTVVSIIIFALMLGLGIFLGQWMSLHQAIRSSRSGSFFGASVQVDVCVPRNRIDELTRALDEVWDRFADIHTRLSVYAEDSDLNRINRGRGEAVRVGEDTYQLIKDSIGYHQLSQGVFDISIGPLIQLWKQKNRSGVLPTSEEIQEAQGRMGLDGVELLPAQKVRLKRAGLKLNIDSIGDGYAADEAARILVRHGFNDFLIDASGELFAGGKNCEGRPWRVGIKDPQDSDKLIDVVEVTNQAVSTSGSYERYFTINGEKWPHIINPVTGYPEKDILSATVIADSAQFADFLSTALCLLPPAEGEALIDKLGYPHASLVIAVDEAGIKAVPSSSFARFLAK